MSPKENNKKVSAAVRILHQKRDASARATHLKATGGIVPSVTIERKIMSTKTITKRIALVAASALAIGGFSAVSANAAVVQVTTTTVTSINLKSSTTSPTAGTAMAVQVGATAAAQAYVNTADNFAINFAGALTSYPSGGFSAVAPAVNAGALATELTDTTAGGAGRLTTAVSGSQLVSSTAAAKGIAAATVTATATTGIGKFTFTPSVAGTYVITVWNENNTDGIINPGETQQTISIVVAAASGYSASLSTAYIAQDLTDDTTGVATSATNAADAPTQIKTLGGKVAQIVVTTRDSANAIYTGQVITATISGAGFVSAGSSVIADTVSPTATEANTADGSATTTRTASVTAALNTTGVVVIGVWADGTSGTGTVTISVTDQISGATTTLATKTVSFYGTVSTLTAETLQGIATPGVANGCSNATTCDQSSLLLTPAVVIVAKDSAGIAVAGLTVTATIADATIVAASSVAIVTGGDDANGRGYYNANVTGGAAANVGKSTTIVYSTTLADGVTKISTAAVTIKVGGTPATVALSLDKASYGTGEAAVVTVTAKDSAGNAVGDGTYANLFAAAATASKAMQGSLPTVSVEIVGGIATFKTFAPAVPGDFTVTATGGTSVASAGRVAVTATASAEGDQSSSLALDAANAATDAANNAYDEAQNATQAASDALAAVTELAAQVTSLIASVKKLTAAVAKLSKKK